MDAAERSSATLSVDKPIDIENLDPLDKNGENPERQASSQSGDAASSPPETSGVDPQADSPAESNHSSYLQYDRETLVKIRNQDVCQVPPSDWDLSQSSELFEPGGRTGQQHHGIYTAAGGHPFPEADLALQQRKDSWRGKSISGNLANGQSVSETDMLMQPRRDDWRGKPGPQPPGFEGPIRSRLVENGAMGDVDVAKTIRQVSGPRAWPHPDEAEPSAFPGPPAASARPLARKESDPSERWNSGQAPAGDTWRGPPGLHGRGPGPEGRERQWGGRGPHPPLPSASAKPVEIPGRTPTKAAEQDTAQARSLERDWRASKGKPGSAPGPSSKEWVNYRSSTQEAQARVTGASEQAERQPHERQRHGSRNNPEWMNDAEGAGADDASGLSVAARRARDFEAERQRMKQEWQKEQVHPKDSAHQPVSMSAFMTDDDLEALKTDANAEPAHEARHQGGQNLTPSMSSQHQQAAENSGLAKFFGQPASSGAEQQSAAFDFTTLAQAAGQDQGHGQGLPQMPPMPKGVTTLEDLERRAGPPPGFAHLHFPPDSASLEINNNQEAAAPQSAPVPAHTLQAAADLTAQESGKALLSFLSKAAASADAPTTSTTTQPQGPAAAPPAAVTPPPGFPAVSKPQAPLSWGSTSQLQGIWGAPTPSTSGSQATWGTPAPNPATHANSAHAQPPGAYSLQGHTSEQAAATGAQPRSPFSPFLHTAASLPDQPGSARQGQPNPAGLLQDSHRAGSMPAQPEPEGSRGSVAGHASNPLLALLGQHRSSATQGSREQDPQLQAFLQAQSGAYSWHPPQPAPKPQMQHLLLQQHQQQQQQQQQYLGQPTRHASNAALSQDLLRQLQLGQNRLQAPAPQTYPQLGHPGLNAYAQSPRTAGTYGANDQSHLQAASPYGQQHQLPFNLSDAVSRAAYGQTRGQTSGQQHLQQAQAPSQTFPFSLGSQAHAHRGIEQQQYSNLHAPASQAYGNNDLASQMLLQQLQQQHQHQHQQHQHQHQQSYSQNPQRAAGLDRFFSPMTFNSPHPGHAPAVPGMQASLAELEARMARQ